MTVTVEQSFTATSLDMARAGSWTLSVYGPMEFEGAAQIQSAIDTLSGAGPTGRVGLSARTDGNRWQYQPDLLRDCVEEIDPVADADIPDVMQQLVRSRDVDKSIWVKVAGNRIFLFIEHGLGDGKLTLDLSLGLLAVRDGVTPPWQHPTGGRGAVAKALGRALVANPRMPLDILRERGRKAAHDDRAPVDAPSRAWSPQPAVGFSRGSTESMADLMRWKAEHAPEVSTAALIMAAKVRAMRAVGFDPSDEIHVLFDCRRYLPPEANVNSNFAIGVDIGVDDPGDPRKLFAEMSTCGAQGRPALTLARTAALTRVSGRAAPPTSARENPRPKLAFSDLGRAPQIAALPWATEEVADTAYIAMVDPGLPEMITFTGGRLKGASSDTVSFHGNVFEPTAVRAALDAATADPVALLDRDDL